MEQDFSHDRKCKKSSPCIGITIGDAAGIGAEVTLKALLEEEIRNLAKIIVIGDARFLIELARKFNLFDDFNVVNSVDEIGENFKSPIIYDLKNLPSLIEYGRSSAICGEASVQYVKAGVELWKKGIIDAIVTAPINKESIALAGYNYPGHTELLAKLAGSKNFAMSFFAGNLRTVLLSTHVSLAEAIKLVRKENLSKLIIFSDLQISTLISKRPKIAVAGLNPHASEGGLFGKEEIEEIIPAISFCKDKMNIDVSGPYSPDTIFLRAFRGEFDVVISCYHDQATIAVKCLAFEKAVNVTLGLPFIRTSVDHGTAFDIAGKNLADASSMIEAIKLAKELVLSKKDTGVRVPAKW